MSALLSTLASIMIPLSFVVVVAKPEAFWWGIISLIFGTIFLALAFQEVRKEQRKSKDEFKIQVSQLIEMRNGITDAINTLITEIRQDRNERKQSDKPKPTDKPTK